MVTTMVEVIVSIEDEAVLGGSFPRHQVSGHGCGFVCLLSAATLFVWDRGYFVREGWDLGAG